MNTSTLFESESSSCFQLSIWEDSPTSVDFSVFMTVFAGLFLSNLFINTDLTCRFGIKQYIDECRWPVKCDSVEQTTVTGASNRSEGSSSTETADPHGGSQAGRQDDRGGGKWNMLRQGTLRWTDTSRKEVRTLMRQCTKYRKYGKESKMRGGGHGSLRCPQLEPIIWVCERARKSKCHFHPITAPSILPLQPPAPTVVQSHTHTCAKSHTHTHTKTCYFLTDIQILYTLYLCRRFSPLWAAAGPSACCSYMLLC